MERPQIDFKKILIDIILIVVAIFFFGAISGVLLASLAEWQAGEPFHVVVTPQAMFGPTSIFYGVVEVLILGALYLAYRLTLTSAATGRLLQGRHSGERDRVEGALENSRWMTDKERNELFPHRTFNKLESLEKDGVPLYAVYNPRAKDMDINMISPARARLQLHGP